MNKRNLVFWIALLAMMSAIGPACEPDDDEGDSSSGSDDDDTDAYCDVVSDQEYECLDQCDAEFGEECHAECVYLPPAEEGSCKDACAANLTTCRADCDEAYEDLSCPDEGPGPADNPTVDDDDDEGDDDAEA